MSDIMILSNFSNLAEIDSQLPEIGTSWLYQMPFFYTFFANTTFEKINIPGAYCGVMPHENSFKIVIGDMFKALPSIKKKEGALIHEYLHIIMETFDRQAERDRKGWNIASDYAINEEVLKHEYSGRKLELPDLVLLFEDLQKLGYPDECVAEKIYDWIAEQQKNQEKKDGDGQGGEGQDEDDQNQDQSSGGSNEGDEGDRQGSGGQSSYGGKRNFDDHTGLEQFKEAIRNNPVVASKVKKIFEQAKANHEIQSKGIGSSSGSLYSFIESISKPTVRWRGLLHGAVQSHLKGSGHKEYSWSKKNRKNLPFPGKKRFNKRVVLAVDTSGSIDDKLAQRFFSEIERISQDNEVTLIQFDTIIQNISIYKKGDWRKIKFTGRGGTCCSELFKTASQTKKLKNTVFVVFSDGGFYDTYETFGLDIIWCIAGPTDACKNGKVILIKDF